MISFNSKTCLLGILALPFAFCIIYIWQYRSWILVWSQTNTIWQNKYDEFTENSRSCLTSYRKTQTRDRKRERGREKERSYEHIHMNYLLCLLSIGHGGHHFYTFVTKLKRQTDGQGTCANLYTPLPQQRTVIY